MTMKWTKRFRDRDLATANKVVCIHWVDSYGSGCWEPIKDQRPQLLNVVSIGYLVGETEHTYSISSTYADETEDTPEQAFGVLVIPKVAVTSFCELDFSLFEKGRSQQ